MLRTKCNLHSVKGTVGMQQSTVVNLRLANRICQVLMYSFAPSLSDASEPSKIPALKTFVVTSDDEAVASSSKELLYDVIQFIGLNYQDSVADVASKKNDQLVKKLRAILTCVTETRANLKSMLPILLEFVTAFDVEIPKLVQSESVHDLRAVTLQENVNTILKKLLKSWFNKVPSEELK